MATFPVRNKVYTFKQIRFMSINTQHSTRKLTKGIKITGHLKDKKASQNSTRNI